MSPLFVDPQLAAGEVLRYLAGWLIVAYAVRRIWRRAYALQALLAVVCLVELGRILILGKALIPSDLMALALCIPAGALLAMGGERLRAALLALVLAAAIVVQGLKPFDFSPHADPFSWIPFKNALSNNLEVSYYVLLEKCFWCVALIWLLARRGLHMALATSLAVLLVGAVEIAQMWIPDRSAEITDPLLALAAGLVLTLLHSGPLQPRKRRRRGNGPQIQLR